MPLLHSRFLAVAGVAILTLGCSRGAEDGGIVASGHVEATDVRLSTKLAATVQSFPVKEGDAVRSGQEVARLDTTDVELALAAARAEQRQTQAELDLRVAGSRAEDVAEAGANVRRAEADLAAATRDLDRMEALLAAGSGTTKARDDALTRRDVAAAALAAARERGRKLEAGFRPQEIEAARARLGAAQARVAQLAQQQKDAVLTSPSDGIVTEKLAEAGELVARGQPLLVVTDLANAWLTVYLPEPDLGAIRIGQEAEVRTDAGETRTGRVTFVSPQAEFTPKNVQTRDERVKLVFKVKIGLDNADGLFKPGMPAEARLRRAESGS
jgi:HlyD family secretion protein